MTKPDVERVSPGEQKLRRLDQRDMAFRILAIMILLVPTIFNIFSAIQLQRLVKQNRNETLAARRVNFERQDQTQNYIKCILLIRFDYPPTSLTNREGIVNALDDCSRKQ